MARMEIIEYLSKDKPYNAWECQECGTITPVTKGEPKPICEYCRRTAELKKSKES